MEAGDAYIGARERIIDLLRTAGPDTPVPATPGWDVADLLRHLVGVTADVVAGDLDEYVQPHWTDRQVQARADRSVDDLLAEWDELTPDMSAIVCDPASHGRDAMFGRAPLVDIVVHEGDLARAVGGTAESDVAVIDQLLAARWSVMDVQRDGAGLPPLEITMRDGPTVTIGDGEPAAGVTVERTALWRSLHGRRTRAQVLAFDWHGDGEPYVDLWLPWVFSFPSTEVERR